LLEVPGAAVPSAEGVASDKVTPEPPPLTVTAPVIPLTDRTGPYFADSVAKSDIWLAV
jgi:hypothetical protein